MNPQNPIPVARRLGALLVVSIVAAGFLPVAQGATAPQRIAEVIGVPLGNPVGGHNTWYNSAYCDGRTCMSILQPGGYVEYSIWLTAPADFIEVQIRGKTVTSNCEVTLFDAWGGATTNYIGCPYSYDTPRTTRFEGVFLDSYYSSAYRVRIACGWGCGINHPHPPNTPYAFSITDLTIVTGYRALTLDPLTNTPGLKVTALKWDGKIPPQQCVHASVRGSLWYGVDYFRVAWGDGQETFEAVPYNTQGEWSRTFCHSYPPKLGNYQVCVTVHDRLDRLVRECKDVSWGTEL